MNVNPKHLEAPSGAMGLRKFTVPRRWYQAAILLADGRLTTEAIAKQLNITTTTLRSWKCKVEFQKITEAYAQQVRAECLTEGVSQKHNRLRRQNKTWNELQDVVEKRAAEAKTPESQVFHVPGADTGWVVVDKAEVVGEGDNARVEVLEVKVDVATAKALLEIEQTAAKEMGGFFEEKPSDVKREADSGRLMVVINFPVMSEEDKKAVDNAVVIDMPQTGRRLLTRPSDGMPR